jgi:fructoselysine 6-phosphate deglycase
VDHVVAYQASYTTGVPIDAADSNYGVLYMLLVGLLRIVSGEDRVTALLSSLSHLQPAIDKAHDQFADKFAAYAAAFRAKDTIYTLASGAAYGAAYSFAICVFMEMLWINSQAIHANEFFHGPFEVVDKDAAFVVLVGLDETRPLAQRAETFLQRFGASQNILVLDAADLDLAGITPEFQSFLVPLIFFDTLWRFAYRLADIRGKVMLEDRRYMKKLTDY